MKDIKLPLTLLKRLNQKLTTKLTSQAKVEAVFLFCLLIIISLHFFAVSLVIFAFYIFLCCSNQAVADTYKERELFNVLI